MNGPAPEHVADMGDHRSHLRALDRLVALASSEAVRLGSIAIGPPHLVLAILDPRAGESRAARALRDCGVTHEAAEEAVRAYAGGDAERGRTPQPNPALLHLERMAEGIAAGLGDAQVRAEHVLLAYLWMPDQSGRALTKAGTSRERVRDRLAELGVSLPRPELPAPDPRRYGPDFHVTLDELRVLLDELWHVIPQGTSFAWNRDRDRGWVSLTEGLEPAPYVESALERHRRAYFEDGG